MTAGKNLYGQLGLGDAQPRGWSKADRFVDFGVGRKVRTMFEGSNAEHSCAILDNDQTKCWGERPPLLPRLACSDFISLNRKSWPGPDADPLRGLQDSPEPEHGNPAFKLGVDYSGCDTVKTDEFKWCEAWSGAPWRLPVADLPALDFGEVPPALDRVCRTRAGASA